jgi:antibiotic biosynthesis monooxygenase (ABM) superfamily enzyme
VRPPRYRFALINWLAVYPVITFVLWLTGPLLSRIPLPVETLVISGLLVSLMNFAVMPLMTHLFRQWLKPHPHHPRENPRTTPNARFGFR